MQLFHESNSQVRNRLDVHPASNFVPTSFDGQHCVFIGKGGEVSKPAVVLFVVAYNTNCDVIIDVNNVAIKY